MDSKHSKLFVIKQSKWREDRKGREGSTYKGTGGKGVRGRDLHMREGRGGKGPTSTRQTDGHTTTINCTSLA